MLQNGLSLIFTLFQKVDAFGISYSGFNNNKPLTRGYALLL